MTVHKDGVRKTSKNSFLVVRRDEGSEQTYWLMAANELHFLWCNPKVWKHAGIISKEGHEPPGLMARPLFEAKDGGEAGDMAWALLTESSK